MLSLVTSNSFEAPYIFFKIPLDCLGGNSPSVLPSGSELIYRWKDSVWWRTVTFNANQNVLVP